jgi:hypothetical protein
MAVSFSAFSVDGPLPRRKTSSTYFCQRQSRSQCHNAARMIWWIETFDRLIENSTRGFPACSVLFQPPTPARVPQQNEWNIPQMNVHIFLFYIRVYIYTLVYKRECKATSLRVCLCMHYVLFSISIHQLKRQDKSKGTILVMISRKGLR